MRTKKNKSRTSCWVKRTLGVIAVSLALFGGNSAYAQVGTPPLWSGTAYNDAIVSTGADRLHAIGVTGRGVSSAVLDTLFDVNHPAYSNNIVYAAHYTEGFGTHDTAPNGGAVGTINVGTNFVDASELLATTWDPTPDANNSGTQHGSHVVGIVHSMAPDAGLVLLNTTAQNASGTEYSAFTQTEVLIDHAADIASTYNIVSFNGSYGFDGEPFDDHDDADNFTPEEAAAITKLTEAGVVGVFASGNDGWNNYIEAPGAVTDAIAIGATHPWGVVAD